MENNKLIKKTAIYLIGNFSSKILSALLIPLYAFYVSSKDLGYFDYLQTLMSMLAPIIVLAIWESILKFSLSSSEYNYRIKVVSNGLLFSLIVMIVLLIFGLSFKGIFFQEFKKYEMFLLMTISYVSSQILQYAARALQLNKIFVISGILSTIINFISVIALVILSNLGINGLLISYIIGQLTVSIYIVIRGKFFSVLNWKLFDLDLLLEMIKYSAPLVLNLVSVWSLSGFGRFLITRDLGAQANGLYSFAFKFSVLISMVGSVVNMAFIEETILTVKEKNFKTNFEKQTDNIAELFIYICSLSMPVIVIFYKFLGATDYSETIIYVAPLILYAFFNILSTNIGTIFQANGQTKILFFTTMLGAVVNIVIAFLLIKNYGIWAIILGQLIGAVVVSIFRYIISKLKYGVTIPYIKILIMIILFSIISIISLKLEFIGNICLITVLTTYFLLKYKQFIISIFSKLKRRRK